MSKLRKPYRIVFQYPDNGYPNANAIWYSEPMTRRLACIGAVYQKRLQHMRPSHEKGTIWIERVQGWMWIKWSPTRAEKSPKKSYLTRQ
jgi:hypothetical protein